MEKKIIMLLVALEPKFLDHDINKHIDVSLKKQIGSCSSEHGYLIEILSFDIIDTEISRASSDIIIRLKVVAMVLKPIIDRVYSVVISACINGNGVYAHCYDKLKILIMERNFSNFKFENGKYVFPDKTIKIGDKFNVIVKAVKYEKNNFQCIGVFE
jgi:hypothetical protein